MRRSRSVQEAAWRQSLSGAVAVFVAALAAVFVAGCATVESGGYVAADGRAFREAPRYAGQSRGDAVSLVVEPEFSASSEEDDHKVVVRPFYRLDPSDEKRSHVDLRKASYRFSAEHFQASVGYGQFTWGVLTSVRPTDVVNQQDFVEAVDGNAKLGQPYAEVAWIGESSALRLEYLPYFRDRTFPGLRGRPRFPVLIDTDSPIFGTRYGRWQPSGAARFTMNEESIDLGFSLFTGLSREPTFVAELTSGQVVPRYDVMHQGSADVQWSVGGLVLKGEGFVRSNADGRRIFGGGGAGLEKTLHAFVDVWDLTLVGEFLYDSRPLGAPITFFQHDAFFGMRLGFNDASSTDVTGGAVVDVIDGTTFGRLEVARGFGEHWKAILGAHVFLGPPGKLESSFRHDDYLQLRIANYF